MFKTTIKLLCLAGLLATGFSADKIAVTTRKQGAVEIKRAEEQQTSELKKGSFLYNSDLVLTGKDGSALILFLDDKSQLKLKGDTKVTISGSRDLSGISKRVNMDFGVLKVSVAEQRKGAFVIETPTSVASVKGTEFWIISTTDAGDIIISNSGTIELVNSETGEVIIVPVGAIIESTPDGQLNILETIKISGRAAGEASGDQFNLNQIQLIEGSVDVNSISGVITISEGTVFEGGAIAVGVQVTVRGAFDSMTGSTVATLVEVATPLQIEAVVTSAVSSGQFGIGEVSVVQGEVETPPGIVGITENTVTEGAEIEVGATVAVTGYYNEETGVINATTLLVTAVVAQINIVTVSGTALSAITNNQFEIGEISVVSGEIETSALSGTIITTSNTELTGAVVDSGLTVVVTGVYSDSTQAILALSITAVRIAIDQIVVSVTGIAQSSIENNLFSIAEITVEDGDVPATNLSGVIVITDSTITDECTVEAGVAVFIIGIYDPASQNIIASIMEACSAEEEMIPVTISGTVQTGIISNQFTLGDLLLIDGDADISALTGNIIVPDNFASGDCEVLPGAQVTVEGVVASSQDVLASTIIVELIVVEGRITSELSNNQIEINVESVMQGNVDESVLTGVVKVDSDTEHEPNDLQVDNIVVIECCRLEIGTGNLIARRITLQESFEHELRFELEDSRGNKKELIITY